MAEDIEDAPAIGPNHLAPELESRTEPIKDQCCVAISCTYASLNTNRETTRNFVIGRGPDEEGVDRVRERRTTAKIDRTAEQKIAVLFKAARGPAKSKRRVYIERRAREAGHTNASAKGNAALDLKPVREDVNRVIVALRANS
mmetsp:Transcript_1766/g.3478  ORF Transcript_1766/g.3478 Transcript_1766/m.3478 type:complete len:143 (+) Transcript_1766:202-630(+)